MVTSFNQDTLLGHTIVSCQFITGMIIASYQGH
jgi:hypothetical protein